MAAFLTRRTFEGSVTSIDGAIAREWTICAHRILSRKLPRTWPAAKFFFTERGDHHALIDEYTAGNCNALAISWEGTSVDRSFLDKLCEKNLVYTDSLFLEVPIGFPIRKDLAAGFSHWMLKADEIDNINLQTTKNQYIRENGILRSCQVQFSAEDFAASDYEKITIKHMGLPIVLFIVCCALAMIGHYFRRHAGKQKVRSLFDRSSQLGLVRGIALQVGSNYSHKKDDDDVMSPRIHDLDVEEIIDHLFERHNKKKQMTSLLARPSQLNTVTDDPSHTHQTLQAVGGRTSLDRNYCHEKYDDVEVSRSVHNLVVEKKGDDFHDTVDTRPVTGRSVVVGDF